MKRILFSSLLVMLMLLGTSAFAGVKIVVLGSSTAAGAGVQSASNAWVNRYAEYLRTLDPTNQVINLAKGGYTTFAIMPEGTPPYDTGANILSVDTERNINKALSYNPGAIIINMPTNDVSNGIPVDTQMDNFKTIIDMAEAAGVEVWITTSQPHNFGETYDGPYGNGKEPDPWKQTARDQFKELTERIIATYGERAIDFYTDIATEDGYSFIRPEYDSGDGTHLNDAAHAILFEKVKEKNIPSQIDESFGGVLANPVYINFGPVSEVGIDNWNLVAAQNTGTTVSPLVDFAGNETSLSLYTVNGFTNAAQNGVSSTAMGMNETISMSNFSSNSSNSPVIEFAGMSPSQVYDFSVYASSSASDTRVCIYTFEGENTVTVSLDAASNTENIAVAAQVIPDELGKVTLTITRDISNNSGFCYINAMMITSATPAVVIPEGAINVETPGTLAQLLEQPVEEITSLVLYGSLNGTDIKTIMEMTALEDIDMYNTSIVSGGDAYLNGMTTRDNIFPQEMFVDNKVIRRVILPNAITELRYHTFMGASALEEVRIPDTVTTFGNDLFSGCSSLSIVNIPTGLRTMGSGCFWNCSKVTSLTFPEGLTVIPGGSFYYCTALKELNLPESLTTIEGDWTFAGCSELRSIVLGPNITTIPAGAFYNCWSLNTIYAKMPVLPVIDTKNGDTPFTGAFKPEYCTLYVPFAAFDTYKEDAVWGGMANIVPLSEVMVDGTPLVPGSDNLQALASAQHIVMTGSTPDAELFADMLASNTSITTIDLTGVTEYASFIPTGNPNCLTYVNSEAEVEGDNIVAVASDGKATAANLVLSDGYDFYNNREFTAASASFTRYFEGGWTTLALPFAADNDGAWIESFLEMDASTITFDTRDAINANEVHLIYYEEPGEHTFTSTQAVVAATAVQPLNEFCLVANYLNSEAAHGYILQTEGGYQYFRQVAEPISSFRGYAVIPDGAESYLVVHDSVPTSESLTDIANFGVYAAGHTLYVYSDSTRTLAVYSIDGRCIRQLIVEEGVNTFDGLCPGLYVVAGNKVVIR